MKIRRQRKLALTIKRTVREFWTWEVMF